MREPRDRRRVRRTAPRRRELSFARISLPARKPSATRTRIFAPRRITALICLPTSSPRPLLNAALPHTPDRSEVSIDVGKMMEQKSKSVSGLTKGIEGLIQEEQGDLRQGVGIAHVHNPGEVVVSKEDGTTETISAKNIILATGSEPAALPGVEVDEETIVTSTGRST